MARLDTGEYRTVRGVRAPTLDIIFKCPTCGMDDVLDAYRGPPTCMGGRRGADVHPPIFMEAKQLVPQV